MSAFGSKTAPIFAALAIFLGGCVTSEHRMDAAADRDDARRTNFEHCRAEGRRDCDAVLNDPVNSNTSRGDSVREQERRDAYNRCVDKGGADCGDLLHHE
jgi:hypothetical protein